MLYDKKWDKELEVQTEPWRKLLNDAADYIEEHGWCQGELRDEMGQVCILGAIASIPDPEDWEPRSVALKALRAITGSPFPDNWNDAPGRTKEEVIAAFRNAARA